MTSSGPTNDVSKVGHQSGITLNELGEAILTTLLLTEGVFCQEFPQWPIVILQLSAGSSTSGQAAKCNDMSSRTLVAKC